MSLLRRIIALFTRSTPPKTFAEAVAEAPPGTPLEAVWDRIKSG